MAQPARTSVAMTTTVPAFNGRAAFSWKGDRYYRVYVKTEELFFIRFSGQMTGELVARQFGLIGMLIWSLLKKRSQRKRAALIEALDRTPLSELVANHEHSFSVHRSQVTEQVLEAAGWSKAHGTYVARWRFTLADREMKMDLRLPTNEDVEMALSLLPPLMGTALRVDLEWNAVKRKYVRRAAESGRAS